MRCATRNMVHDIPIACAASGVDTAATHDPQNFAGGCVTPIAIAVLIDGHVESVPLKIDRQGRWYAHHGGYTLYVDRIRTAPE